MIPAPGSMTSFFEGRELSELVAMKILSFLARTRFAYLF